MTSLLLNNMTQDRHGIFDGCWSERKKYKACVSTVCLIRRASGIGLRVSRVGAGGAPDGRGAGGEAGRVVACCAAGPGE